MSRKTKAIISEGEYYHVFNRGVEKRDIFIDQKDIKRFLESIKAFNTLNPIGSIHQSRAKIKSKTNFGSPTPKKEELVIFVAYCLNHNHFHFLIKPLLENGLQKFMQRLGTGYTNYFNEKYKRSGVLFQGKYKRVIILSNEQLLHTSVYVNLNNRFGKSQTKINQSSWNEYFDKNVEQFCNEKSVILDQFKKPENYRDFALSSLEDIKKRKENEKEI